ncbi:MAG: hypothetical protein EGP87_05420 [Paraprevotella clara]|nr:hypothetical protein [Paraprevotella clara]
MADVHGNTRISCIVSGATCKRFMPSLCHGAGTKGRSCRKRKGECKFGACPACRFDIFLLATGTCRIEKKRASTASPDFVFKKVFGR